MSYEGYERFLCKVGHLTEVDCYDHSKGDCPRCGLAMVWRELVDTTNDEGIETALALKTLAIYCTCKDCGVGHLKEAATYEIPTTSGPIRRSAFAWEGDGG